MRKAKKFIIITIILVVAVLFYFIPRQTRTGVKEILIEKRMVQKTISASGIVKAENEANLSFASMGRVAKIYVEDNQKVAQGQLLAVIDNYVDSQTAQSYKDARDVAKKDLDYFVQEYEKDKDDIGGEKEYDIQLDRYTELLNKAEASYQAALGNVAKGFIYSPFDGYVIDIYKKEGETASIAESILKIADISNLYFQIEVDQEDFGYLKKDQKVDITFDSYGNEKFHARVSELPKYTNSKSGTDFVVDIYFEDDITDNILLGMEGDAHIILAKTEDKVNSLAFDEIYYDFEDKPYVYILDNQKVKKQYITLGLQGDIYTEIVSELPQTVLSPAASKDKLEEGKQVRIIK